jgi:hypothetical protein
MRCTSPEIPGHWLSSLTEDTESTPCNLVQGDKQLPPITWGLLCPFSAGVRRPAVFLLTAGCLKISYSVLHFKKKKYLLYWLLTSLASRLWISMLIS